MSVHPNPETLREALERVETTIAQTVGVIANDVPGVSVAISAERLLHLHTARELLSAAVAELSVVEETAKKATTRKKAAS